MKKKEEIFIITESNPNNRDPFNWEILLRTTLFKNEKEANEFVDTLIENYLNLYVECWNEYPKLQRFTDSKNNLYVDKWTWYLERWNIKVKKSMWEF